jgi:hypothetical protein
VVPTGSQQLNKLLITTWHDRQTHYWASIS